MTGLRAGRSGRPSPPGEGGSLLPRGHAEDRLRGLVQLRGQGQASLLLGADDKGVVLAGDLDEEQQLVAREVQHDAVLVLVEEAFEQLVPQPQPRFLLLVGDEVVLLARDLLEEDQLLAVEVEGYAADVGHHRSILPKAGPRATPAAARLAGRRAASYRTGTRASCVRGHVPAPPVNDVAGSPHAPFPPSPPSGRGPAPGPGSPAVTAGSGVWAAGPGPARPRRARARRPARNRSCVLPA